MSKKQKDDYQEFLKSKQKTFIESGFEIDESELNSNLFDFQRYSVKISLRKGRFALFQDCGLGKTIQQLEFAHQCSIKYNKPSLILAPLAVVAQTIEQGQRFGYDVYRFDFENTPCENEPDIFILNYDQLKNIDCIVYVCVVLDESSILKGRDGKLSNMIIQF